jgi:hypothetical protein
MNERQPARGTRQRAARWGAALCLVPFFVALGGCRSADKLEAELRQRETALREAHDELGQCQAVNAALQRELHDLHEIHSDKVCPEQVHATATLKTIALGRATGGTNEDHCPGDHALQVVVEPHDCDGHTIKAAGTLQVAALEILEGGVKKPLSTWVLAPEQLRHTWKSGLWSSGYVVILPWKEWPTTDKLRVVVQLIAPDGRLFEADKDVTLHLPPPAARKPLPAEPETPLLPPPRPVEGPSLSLLPPPGPLGGPLRVVPTETRSLRVDPAKVTATGTLSGAVQLGPPE